jgi:hypothetical protein
MASETKKTWRTVTVQRCPSGGRGYVVEVGPRERPIERRYAIGNDGNAVRLAIFLGKVIDAAGFAAQVGRELKSRRRVSLLVEVAA